MIQAILKTKAIALSSVVPNHHQNICSHLWLTTNGITKSSVIGQIKKAVRGEAICSTLKANQKTLHCLLKGATFCKIVCSEASIYRWSDIK